jgi:hypothetical protein
MSHLDFPYVSGDVPPDLLDYLLASGWRDATHENSDQPWFVHDGRFCALFVGPIEADGAAYSCFGGDGAEGPFSGGPLLWQSEDVRGVIERLSLSERRVRLW